MISFFIFASIFYLVDMTVVPPLLPGVVTRSRNASAAVTSPLPAAKRSRVAMKETTTPSISQQPTCSASANSNLEQWLADVSNVDISLSVSLGAADATTSEQSISPQSSDHHNATSSSSSACLSIPDLLTRLLQTKLAIDPARLTTMIKDPSTLRDASVFVALAVKGREEPIQDAIEGGLTPRKAFLRSAPHISRVASRLQDCIRQIFGIDDFVVKVD